jgi:hypothetical protein
MWRSLTIWAAVAVGLAGCSSLRLLDQGSGGRPKSHADQIYLSKLSAEQSRLAADERRLPLHPRTPGALSHSIRALARTIDQFGNRLAAITPPGSVAPLHQRLVGVARRYAQQLATLAGRAGRPAQEVAAANALAADTNAASDEFTATFVQIHARLVR